MTSPWQPFREPLRATLVRNGIIALVAGAVLARWQGGLARWPLLTLLLLWLSLGGHCVELWFLNFLRPRLPDARAAQVAFRLVVHGIAVMMRAMGYQGGPNSGPRFQVATAPTMQTMNPMNPMNRARAIG